MSESIQDKIEKALESLSGFLIEPIKNEEHPDHKKRKVMEIQGESIKRDYVYSDTFIDCLLQLSEKYTKNLEE